MERTPVQKPPKDLIEKIKSKKVVPIIGAGLSKQARLHSRSQSAMPDNYELLQKMIDSSDLDSTDKKIAVLFLKKARAKPSEIDFAASFIREKMGEWQFYKKIREILEPIDARFEISLAHKLLRMMNFRIILSTNYDRLLERFVAPNHEMFTASDIEAFRLIADDPNRKYILKLHGDITRPNTIPFDLDAHYGFDVHGNPVKEKTKVAREIQFFLEKTFRENTILFLGSSLTESEGYARLLKGLVQSWGGFPHKHYALVAASENQEMISLRKELSEKQMNLVFITYVPDNVHSQLWEFIAFLNSGVQSEPPIPGKEWERSYLPEKRVDYLKFQLEREKTATAVNYLTPTLTNALITDEYLEFSIRESLESRFGSKRLAEEIFNTLISRRQNLEERIKEGNIDIRVLFLEIELQKPFKTEEEKQITINRYSHLLELMEYPNLQVRLVPGLTREKLRDLYQASYALIFNKIDESDKNESDVAIAYAAQANINYYELNISQVNTSEVRDRVYQFERFWTSALDKKNSKETIKNIVHRNQS